MLKNENYSLHQVNLENWVVRSLLSDQQILRISFFKISMEFFFDHALYIYNLKIYQTKKEKKRKKKTHLVKNRQDKQIKGLLKYLGAGMGWMDLSWQES